MFGKKSIPGIENLLDDLKKKNHFYFLRTSESA
jgi:hypothetical protein